MCFSTWEIHVLQCNAACCRVLPVRCRVFSTSWVSLQIVGNMFSIWEIRVSQCNAVCCSVMHCVAAYCSALLCARYIMGLVCRCFSIYIGLLDIYVTYMSTWHICHIWTLYLYYSSLYYSSCIDIYDIYVLTYMSYMNFVFVLQQFVLQQLYWHIWHICLDIYVIYELCICITAVCITAAVLTYMTYMSWHICQTLYLHYSSLYYSSWWWWCRVRTHSHMCHDSWTCVPWRIHVCAVTHSYLCSS